jgi:hypothetical protein
MSDAASISAVTETCIIHQVLEMVRLVEHVAYKAEKT